MFYRNLEMSTDNGIICTVGYLNYIYVPTKITWFEFVSNSRGVSTLDKPSVPISYSLILLSPSRKLNNSKIMFLPRKILFIIIEYAGGISSFDKHLRRDGLVEG